MTEMVSPSVTPTKFPVKVSAAWEPTGTNNANEAVTIRSHGKMRGRLRSGESVTRSSRPHSLLGKSSSATSAPMRIRIVYRPHSPWIGEVQVTDEALRFKGVPYAPTDRMDGTFVEQSTASEDVLIAELGFDLDRVH